MKITVTFDSVEEFMQHMTTGVSADPAPVKINNPAERAAQAPEASEPEESVAEAVEDPMPAPEEEKPAEEAPAYVLADAQKAVREVVKKKGKDAAKEILSHYRHKDKEDSPATGASALRPEDYAAAIKELEEALNG